MARQTSANHSQLRFIAITLGLFIIIAAVWLVHEHAAAPGENTAPANQTAGSAQASFDKHQYSLSNPSSQWVIVNKHRPLTPRDYAPPLTVPDVKLRGSASAQNMHVSTQMAPHLETLFGAAAKAGYPLMLSSGYRSYAYQVQVYNREVSSQGQSGADQESARPGYSEHQTGLAADVAPASGTCDLSQCFGSTPTGQWLAANAYEYGFIIRYPEGKQAITGYEYEPWHIRYVGSSLSEQMHKDGITTLEEFFNLGAAPSYN